MLRLFLVVRAGNLCEPKDVISVKVQARRYQTSAALCFRLYGQLFRAMLCSVRSVQKSSGQRLLKPETTTWHVTEEQDKPG